MQKYLHLKGKFSHHFCHADVPKGTNCYLNKKLVWKIEVTVSIIKEDMRVIFSKVLWDPLQQTDLFNRAATTLELECWSQRTQNRLLVCCFQETNWWHIQQNVVNANIWENVTSISTSYCSSSSNIYPKYPILFSRMLPDHCPWMHCIGLHILLRLCHHCPLICCCLKSPN